MSEVTDESSPSVLERLIRIEVLLETRFNDLATRSHDHETRLRAVEGSQRGRWQQTVLVALLSTAAAVIASMATLLVRR